jgi:hypothetical protein
LQVFLWYHRHFSHRVDRLGPTKNADAYDVVSRKKEGYFMSVKTSVGASSLVEVLDRILDKGIVIDIFAIVSLVGIELLTVEARIVIASVETWLCYARAVGLLEHHRDVA